MGVITAALGRFPAHQSARGGRRLLPAPITCWSKRALFLTINARLPAGQTAREKGWTMALTAALALSLAGLPFTGGSLAQAHQRKHNSKNRMEQTWQRALLDRQLAGDDTSPAATADRHRDASIETPRLITAWPALAIGAICHRGFLFPMVGDIGRAIAPTKSGAAFWPVACGIASRWASRRERRKPAGCSTGRRHRATGFQKIDRLRPEARHAGRRFAAVATRAKSVSGSPRRAGPRRRRPVRPLAVPVGSFTERRSRRRRRDDQHQHCRDRQPPMIAKPSAPRTRLARSG